MGDNRIYIEKYDSVTNDAYDYDYENDPSAIVDGVYSDLLQDDGDSSWLPKILKHPPFTWLIKIAERVTDSITLESNTTNTFSMIIIAIVLLLAPLFILGFFGSTDQDSSYVDILYRSILQLVDTIWSFCMAPFDAVLRLVSPASYSPLLVDEDDIKEDETVNGPSPRRRILRSLVSKTQQTMPPLVPIPGAKEKLPERQNLKQSQPPPELEPAFLNSEDYPPGWLVFHPELGVVSKEEADAYDQNQATQLAEKETNTVSEKQQSDGKEERHEMSKEEIASTTSEEVTTNGN